MRVYRIPPKCEDVKKKVTAYARVSTLSEIQEDSYETQVLYYTHKINKSVKWEFIPIYSDHGFSGTSAHTRPGFMRMINDARDKKFDIILVKSISRFARNASDAQKYVKYLKEYNIEVIFEREGISSFDTTAEMTFNILASCAQEESRAISKRIQWSVHKRMEMGIYYGYGNTLGYNKVGTTLVPNNEAWIVEQIFSDYAAGIPINAIIKRLTNKGILSKNNTPYNSSQIKQITNNEIYIGDRIIQRKPPNNYITHKSDITIPYKSHYVLNNHTAIISKELWTKVQKRRINEAIKLNRITI